MRALDKFLFNVYDEKSSKRARLLNKFDDDLDAYIGDRGGSTEDLYIIYYLKDALEPDGKPYITIHKYNPEDFKNFRLMVADPLNAWEYWSGSSPEQLSDIPNLLAGDSHAYLLYKIGVYTPNSPMDVQWNVGLTDEERSALNTLFFTIDERSGKEAYRRVRVGRFMKWGLDKEKLAKSDNPAAVFFRNIRDKDFLEKELQVPWFTKYNEPLKEGEEGEDPIQNEIYRTPCLLYALKDQVSKECYDEIEQSKKLTARGAKITLVRGILKKYGYIVKQYNIEKKKLSEGENIYVREYKLKGLKEGKEVKLMFWEDHWMKYYEVSLGAKPVCIIKLFEMLKEAKILYPYNVYELAKNFQCYSFDSMLHWSQEKVQELVKKTIPNNYEFTEKDWDLPEYKEPKQPPKVVFFADFEATTDEKYHVPFLICGKGYYVKEGGFTQENEIKIHDSKDNMIISWQIDCPKTFLDIICKNIYTNRGQRKRNPEPIARIYFFNLKYDITFILPYLKEINKIEKDGRIYSCTGFYNFNGSKVFFDFWDAYPLFQSSLARAGNDYLTEEEKKSIKKEAFPYKTYTYKFFEDHLDNFDSNGISYANIEEFERDPNFQAFYERIKEDLKQNGKVIYEKDNEIEIESPFAKKWKRKTISERIDLNENEETITKSTIKQTRIDVKWMEYAEFYCCQDVRILAGVMNNMKKLMKAEGCEGIHGVPPFSQDLLKYRTASSLSYDYFLRTVVFNKTADGWESKHNIVFPKALLRYLIQLTVRGGRVMCRDNDKYYYKAANFKTFIQDFDAVSLYTSAMSRLWISEGIPRFLNGFWDQEDFKRDFCDPEDDENKYRKPYTDGCLHLTWLYTKKPRHFPQLCIKDKRTGLNEYKNYDGEVDTWVNMIDLYDLIDFQDAEFKWDLAVVWTGPRRFEIRESIKNLFEFRKANHGKGVEHPIQNVAKVMMNSIYGKSVIKASDKKKLTLDIMKKRKRIINVGGEERVIWYNVNNWHEWFKANSYRIHSFEPCEGDKVNVTVYCRDMSHSFNIFGSNVLAMARRQIGRVMSLAEDLEEKYPGLSPGLFYTDTDSMHIRQDLLDKLIPAFKEKYGWDLIGPEMCQFHNDFDVPKNFKKGEYVLGADESWFIAKKMYADRLVGSEGTVGYHKRMKGIPGDIVDYDHYRRIYEGEIVEFNLLANGKTSFFFEGGHVGCRLKMTREIGTKEAKKRKRDKELEEKKAKKVKPVEKEPEIIDLTQPEIIDLTDDNTVELPSAQEMPIDLNEIIDIE